MFRILIADDEEDRRYDLIRNINWEKLGVSVAGEAEDGKEALSLALKVMPDIILTDVRMPKMNGIEFALQVRKIIPDCKIIFFSGFTDKEYLLSAIKMEAVDYIEKPIVFSEVIAAVQKAIALKKQKLEKDEKAKGPGVNYSLLRNDIASEIIHQGINRKLIKEKINESGVDLSIDCFFTCIVLQFNGFKAKNDRFNNIRDYTTHIVESVMNGIDTKYFFNVLDEDHAVIYLTDATAQNILMIKKATSEIQYRLNDTYKTEGVVTIGVGKPFRGIENAYLSYQTAKGAVEKSFFTGYNSINIYDDKPADSAIDIAEVEKIVKHIKKSDWNKSIELMRKFAEHAKKHGLQNISQVKEVLGKTEVYILDAFSSRGFGNKNVMEIEWSLNKNHFTMDELTDFLIRKLEKLSREIELDAHMDKRIRKALQYIHENYFGDLSIAEIASNLNLAPNYLCNLFKKETGMTLNICILNTRIEIAKELLANNDEEKIDTIARKVGFNNAAYFSITFKKVTGLNPSEYRRSADIF